jgi:hypothetical protein
MAAKFGSGRIASATCLSPLLDLKGIGDMGLGYDDAIKTHHHDIDLGERAEFVADYNDLVKQHEIDELIAGFPKEIAVEIIQAQNDPITRDDFAEKMLARFPKAPIYTKVNVNHSFIGPDRVQVGQRIVRLIRGCDHSERVRDQA